MSDFFQGFALGFCFALVLIFRTIILQFLSSYPVWSERQSDASTVKHTDQDHQAPPAPHGQVKNPAVPTAPNSGLRRVQLTDATTRPTTLARSGATLGCDHPAPSLTTLTGHRGTRCASCDRSRVCILGTPQHCQYHVPKRWPARGTILSTTLPPQVSILPQGTTSLIQTGSPFLTTLMMIRRGSSLEGSVLS
jgi:hypothetical protein